jgi:hypothetical protein
MKQEHPPKSAQKQDKTLSAEEQEPNAPGISEIPEQSSKQAATSADQEKEQDITETEGYKTGLRLLQLAFQDDKEEITRQAMQHADSLQEGLKYLKSQGYDFMHQITANMHQINKNEGQRQRIISDFEKALSSSDEKTGKEPTQAPFEPQDSLLKDLFVQGMSNQMYLEQRKRERARKQEVRRAQMKKESVEDSLKQQQKSLPQKDDEEGLLKGVQDFMKQHLSSLESREQRKVEPQTKPPGASSLFNNLTGFTEDEVEAPQTADISSILDENSEFQKLGVLNSFLGKDEITQEDKVLLIYQQILEELHEGCNR